MANKASLLNVANKISKTPAAQTAGKVGAVVAGGTVAAYAIPTATGAGLNNLGGGGQGGTLKGLALAAAIVVIAVFAVKVLSKVIK